MNLGRGTTIVVALSVCGFLANPPLVASEAPGVTDRREQARTMLLQGDAEDAADLYAELCRADPADADSRAGRVRALLALDRWKEALDEASRFAEALPEADQVEAALGEALIRAGRLTEAEDRLEPMAERQEAPARALVALGRIRNAQGRDDEARTLMDRALERAPADRHVLYWTASAASTRAGIVERLQRYLEVAEGDDPDRITAAEGKIRLYRALGERPLWVPATSPDRVEVPLEPLGDGTGRVVGLVLAVKVGDRKPARLLLDTGSTGLFVVHRMAVKRGFEPLSEETLFGGGGGRRHVSPRGLFPTFAVGNLRFTDALAATTRHEFDPTGRFHGVVGLSAFRGYRVTLDLEKHRLVLDRKQGTGAEAGEPYWDVSGQLLVRASVSSGESGLFLLDTGATSSTVAVSLLESAGEGSLGEAVDVRGFGGNIAGVRRLRGQRVLFQGSSSGGSWVNAADLSMRSRLGGVEVSGFVGLDLLAERRLVVETRSQRVQLLEPETGRPKKSKKRKSRKP